MMTSAQNKGYWRRWSAACRRHGWEASDAKRHEMHMRALGRDKSSKKFNQDDVDRTYAFMELLAKGLNMEEAEAFLPIEIEKRERKRLVFSIHEKSQQIIVELKPWIVEEREPYPIDKEAEDYVILIVNDKFRHRLPVDDLNEVTVSWRNLPMELLRELHMTICNRERAQRGHAVEDAAVSVGAPF